MKQVLTSILAALVCAAGLLAQMPQFKSQEEVDAFMAVQNATTVQERASAGADFIAKFPNSEAVTLASYLAMLSYQQLNDFENMLLYGELLLEGDPAPGMKAGALISLANAIPSRTGEFDLDKEEKLGKAADYAKEAMAVIPQLAKMDPNMSDDDWLATKMEFMSQCHEALGQVHLKREDFESAVESLRKALEMAPNPVPFTYYNLATALSKLGKNEEAAAMADKCMEGGGVQAGDGRDLCAAIKNSL